MNILTPSFDSITSGLRKIVSKLERLVVLNSVKTTDLAEEIDDLYTRAAGKQTEKAEVIKESDRALSTAAKIKELLGE